MKLDISFLLLLFMVMPLSGQGTNPKQARPKSVKNYQEVPLPTLQSKANGGDAAAEFELGTRYALGKGGAPLDYPEAKKWYRRAAARGHVDAQFRVGFCYFFGDLDTEVDWAEAMPWLLKAAKQGHAASQFELGEIYRQGCNAIPKDFHESARWYRKSAYQGNPFGQWWTSQYYRLGLGVPEDISEAYVWQSIAATSGKKEDAQQRDQLAAQLSTQALEAAQVRARKLAEEISANMGK